MDRLRFYFLRLRRASTAEIAHRLKERLLLLGLKRAPGVFSASLQPPDVEESLLRELKLPEIARGNDPIQAGEIMAGKVFCLGFGTEQVEAFEERWREVFCGDVRYDADDPDIRAVWEKGRLQHLMILLDEISRGGGEQDQEAMKSFARKGLLDWLEANPFARGPHYMSVMECALRLPVFLYALKILDNLGVEDAKRLVRAVYEHGWLTEKRLSLYSSLGNHTTCEAYGMVLAGAVFASSGRGRRWLETGVKLLRQECVHQILEDGGPAEKSLKYHRFVLDVLWLAVDFLEANGLADCGEMRERLAKGEVFYAAHDSGGVPNIGDSDDGRAVAPGLYPAARAVTSSQKKDGISVFEASGCTVVHGGNGEFLTFDHGSLGMAPFYNHGHADALSVTACKRGKPFLVDPGTFRYNGPAALRRWFKGTSAHNTVTVDSMDQAEQLTSFIWKEDCEVDWKVTLRDRSEIVVDAELKGYGNLGAALVHRRIFHYKDGSCLLLDSFMGSGAHEYELRFILHPEVKTEFRDGWRKLVFGEESMYLKLLDGELDFYSKESERAWFSEEYGSMRPTGLLARKKSGETQSVTFKSILHFGPDDPDEASGKFSDAYYETANS